MRVVVYPAMMEIGGSQLNAIELAAELRRTGHEVVLYAPEGELNEVAAAQGVEVVRSACDGRWPTVAGLAGLVRLVRRRRIEIVHAYEWGPSVEAALGPYALLGAPMITTVLSMDVPHLIPLEPELIVGTAELLAEQQGVRTTHLAEPWIDTEANRPRVTDRVAERARFGLDDDDLVITVVCRLTSALEKADGVLAAIVAVRELNATGTNSAGVRRRHRLLVVGDGERLEEVRAAADRANAAAGHRDIVVTGPLLDPRAAYDCADVVIGMGSSALKGLAFAKPLVVQGTGGYWLTFDQQTKAIFDHQGFFGHGDRTTPEAGAAALVAALRPLLDADEGELTTIGRLGRDYIESRFSLRAAAAAHARLYEQVVARRPSVVQRARTAIRTSREAAKLNLALRRGRRRPGRGEPVATVVAQPEVVAAAASEGTP